MSTVDYVVACYGHDSKLHIQWRNLRTNEYIGSATFSGPGVGSGIGSNDFLFVYPSSPSPLAYLATTQSIAVVDASNPADLTLSTVIPVSDSLIGGSIAGLAIPPTPTSELGQYSGSSTPKSLQTIDYSSGDVVTVAPLSSENINDIYTPGGPIVGSSVSGILVATVDGLFIWDPVANTYSTPSPEYSGKLYKQCVAVNFGDGNYAYTIGTYLSGSVTGDFIWGGVLAEFDFPLADETTDPAIKFASCMITFETSYPLFDDFAILIVGNDGTNMHLYSVDARTGEQSIDILISRPQSYGTPDYICASNDGGFVYLLDSNTGYGYPVDLTEDTPVIGPIVNWNVPAPRGAVDWFIENPPPPAPSLSIGNLFIPRKGFASTHDYTPSDLVTDWLAIERWAATQWQPAPPNLFIPRKSSTQLPTTDDINANWFTIETWSQSIGTLAGVSVSPLLIPRKTSLDSTDLDIDFLAIQNWANSIV